MSSQPLTLELFGEGKTELGPAGDDPERPTRGVLPVLVHKLCGSPSNMLVKRKTVQFLQGKTLWQKVAFAKRQAFYNKAAGLMFVVDTEGDQKGKMTILAKGRDSGFHEFPMAVGAPHPCIETWLLADATAIVKALGCPKPQLPDDPESLPAPRKNPKYNPKTVLADCVGSPKGGIDAAQATSIVAAMRDLSLVRQRCSTSFAPFADEVEQQIKPLFDDGPEMRTDAN